jgi:arabinose-5-phosphate isomerase
MQENNISQLVVVSEDERQEVLGFVHIHNLIKEGII